MKINKILLSLLAIGSLFGAVSCDDDDSNGGDLSNEAFFINQTLAYTLTSDSEIVVSVARLDTSGDLTVNLSSSGSSIFTIPSSVTIADGNRVAEFNVDFSLSDLAYNTDYEYTITIGSFSSIYGYGSTTLTIQYPTSYYEYGSGTIVEDWWAEEEEKTLYVRDYSNNVLQCYLPDCWGHDSGASYDVQDYVFYWNTATNKLYIPVQYMGYMYISDLGAYACKFEGPDYTAGSTDWMSWIDSWYTTSCDTAQPHYDPETDRFYLADVNPFTEAGASAGYSGYHQDILTIE